MADSIDEKVLCCPQCKDLLCAPIFQCTSGHSVCHNCQKRMAVCSSCKLPITKIRNLQLEQVIETVKPKIKVECTFKYKGCTYKMKAHERARHEKECRYNTHKCEAGSFLDVDCKWKGSFDDIYDHFVQEHADCTRTNFKACGTLKLNAGYKNLQIIEYGKGQNYFYYKIKVDHSNEKVYVWFKLIGLEMFANRYYYEFEIHKGDVKKIKYCMLCNSHAMSDTAIINNESCAVFSFKQLKAFKNENEEIAYRFRIMKNT